MLRAFLPLVPLLLVAAISHRAEAGPSCGNLAMFGPSEAAVLPPGPTIAFGLEDSYYGGKRKARARPKKVTATIDGKPVGLRVRDVSMGDGVLRFLTVQSKRAGKLELWMYDPYTQGLVNAATYTIAETTESPTAATGTLRRTTDRRLGPYRYIGEQLAISVDVPAIAFSLRWRSPKGAWKTRMLPVNVENDQSEARLGATICGMSRNLPAGVLEAGIEVELTAFLPDGKKLVVGDLPNPVVMTD